LASNEAQKRELQRQVTKSTAQLKSYASELETARDELSSLNTDLEARVDARTKRLQLEIIERNAAEEKLYHLAFHDSLTGLKNRQWLIQTIDSLIVKARRGPGFTFSVMLIDGDKFKHINDTFGHNFGDSLLCAAAKSLEELLSANQYAGRLGGDEFVIISQGLDEDAVSILAQKVDERLSQGFNIQDNLISFKASIGALICDYSYQSTPDVLRDTDIALAHAKTSSQQRFKLFDKALQQHALERIALEQGLNNAIANNELFVVYQPLVELSSGKLYGFEALLRWIHPEKGFVPPDKFIPIAEETGLIWQLGQFVLSQACHQTKQWHQTNEGILPTISVNISVAQLHNEQFLSSVDNILKLSGLDASYLKLELTESLMIENNQQFSELYEQLLHRNIELAIDDFGTGFSSLAYLSEIPANFLKIDRKFISSIDEDGKSKVNQEAIAVLRSTISLGQSLNKKVTAEGIETKTQLAQLIALGCDLVQGYYLAKPLSVEDANILMKAQSKQSNPSIDINKSEFADSYAAREGDD
jgi:diguanylate cyclase (GGDEF)-like protein